MPNRALTPDLYAVIGHPVAHSQSPFIHGEFARQTEEALIYERRLAPLDGFSATLSGFAEDGGRGCSVTVPFKFEAFALATRHAPRAALAGAVPVKLPLGVSRGHYMAYKNLAGAAAPQRVKDREMEP